MKNAPGTPESDSQFLWLIYESEFGLKSLGIRDVVRPLTCEFHTVYVSLIADEYGIDWKKLWLISPEDIEVKGDYIVGKINEYNR